MKKFFIITLISLFNFAFSQEFAASSIPETLKNKAHAVVRKDITTLNINSINEIVTDVERTVTVLDKAGDEFALVSIPYDKSLSVSDIKVIIYDAFGRQIKKYSKSDFTDVKHNTSFSFYDDNRVLYLRYMPATYPYSVQYSYTSKNKNTVFLPDFYPLEGYHISTENSSLIINNKSGIKLRTKITENNNFAKLTYSENGTNYQYSFSNVEAIEKEQMSPSLEQFLPKVEFSLDKFTLEEREGNLTDWKEFGNWFYNNLIQPSSAITPELRAEVAALNLSGTTYDKVKKLYQYMQSKTRYVAILEGIGGWKPMLAEDVRSKGYGDCKALTNYMRTLLDIAGIKSYYSRIKDNESVQKYDLNFPKMGGNHIVLMIPTENGNIWLENTSQTIAFNHLSYTSLDRNVMAIAANDIKIIDTPSYAPEDSKEILTSKIILNTDNSIAAETQLVYSGSQYDFQLPITSLTKDRLSDHIKDIYDILKIETLNINKIENNRDKALVNLDFKFVSKDFSKNLGNDMFFRAVPFIDHFVTNNGSERKLPLEIPFSYQDDFTIDYVLPIGYKLSEIPAPVTINSEFGDYQLNFETKDNMVKVRRIITIKKKIYPKEKYQDYINFRKKTTNHDNTKLLIQKI